MDELIDIINTNGIPTGKTCMKSKAHNMGYLHASIHVWFYTKDHQILIQLRKEDKDTYPNLWDVSVAGHIGAGETAINTAIRETKEEIGYLVKEEELTKIPAYTEKHFLNNNIIDNEYHHIYLAPLKSAVKNLTPQPEEVAALKLISFSDLKKALLEKDTSFVPHDKGYNIHILKHLEQLLDTL